MAKLTALQALNRVLRNIGEEQASALTSLTNLQMLCFEKLNEAIQEVCTDQNTRWQFLESLGVVPMTTGNYQYQITGLSTGSDMMREDRESFRQADSGYTIKYITPQEFDALYPKGISTDVTGYPDKYTKFGGYLVFNKQATATQNAKNISFRYWKLPTLYATATATGTSDIPEPFDITVITNLATMKVMAYLGNEEAMNYKAFSDEGLGKMTDQHSSPDVKARCTYVF